MRAERSEVSLPWRTILAALGGVLLLSQGLSIYTKLFLVDLSAADADSREFISQTLVRNTAMATLGAAMLGLGLVLALRRRSRNVNTKKAG